MLRGHEKQKLQLRKNKTASRLMQRRSALGNACPSKNTIAILLLATVRPAALRRQLNDQRQKTSKDAPSCIF